MPKKSVLKGRVSLLRDVVLKGDEARVRKALAQGISPDQIDEAGGTGLMCASKLGFEGIGKILLSAGARVNLAMSKKLSSTRGRTALIYAAEYGHMNIAKHLVAAGANVNAETTWGESPLYHATRRGDLRMVSSCWRTGQSRRGWPRSMRSTTVMRTF